MFELNIQKNWIDALYARSSVRQYTSAPDKAQLDKLGETCRKLSWQGVKIRMFKGPGLKPDQGHGCVCCDYRQARHADGG